MTDSPSRRQRPHVLHLRYMQARLTFDGRNQCGLIARDPTRATFSGSSLVSCG